MKGFSQADSQKEWISSLRGLYRFLPFARSTYRHAAAIIAASSQTYAEFAVYRDKLFFVPEPGIGVKLVTAAELVEMIKSGDFVSQLHLGSLLLAELRSFITLR